MKTEPTRDAPATTGATVEYQVKFSTGPKGRKRVRTAETAAPVSKAEPTPLPLAPVPPLHSIPPVVPAVAPAPRVAAVPTPTTPAQPAPVPRVPKITLLLVLGHHFEGLVRDGIVKDYADIGRRTGLTRARVTQIVNLTLLAPGIQEQILGRGSARYQEHGLREAVTESIWRKQRRSLNPVGSHLRRFDA